MSGNGSSSDGWVGRSIPRVEDARHLTGRGLFVDDIERPRMLYAAFVRSPFGAARVKEVSVKDALEIPGVERPIIRSDLESMPGLKPVLHRPEFVGVEVPLLSGNSIRHAGEPVAMVLADSPHAAEDGADTVQVDYERQEPVVSLDAALAENARTVHDEIEDNVLLDVRVPDDPEVDEAFEEASAVIEATFTTGRVAAGPMGGGGVPCAGGGRGGKLVFYTSTQV